MRNNKINKLFISFLFVILLSIGLVSAVQEDLGTFKLNDCVTIKQICANCTYVNISSIVYPNSSIAVSNAIMTKTGTEYNFDFCNNSLQGQYIVNGVGDPNGLEVFAYTYNITPNGSNSNSLGLIAIMFVLVALAGIMCWVGMNFDSSHWLVKSGLYMGSLLVMVIAVNIGINFSIGERMTTLMTTVLVLTVAIVGAFFMYILVYYLTSLAKAVKEAKEDRDSEGLI